MPVAVHLGKPGVEVGQFRKIDLAALRLDAFGQRVDMGVGVRRFAAAGNAGGLQHHRVGLGHHAVAMDVDGAPRLWPCRRASWRAAVIGRGAADFALKQHEDSRAENCGNRSLRRGYFSSAAVEVAGPSPMIRRTASSSLAPSQVHLLGEVRDELPAGIGVGCWRDGEFRCPAHAASSGWPRARPDERMWMARSACRGGSRRPAEVDRPRRSRLGCTCGTCAAGLGRDRPRISRTEKPLPVPRLNAPPECPSSSSLSASTWAAARSVTWM